MVFFSCLDARKESKEDQASGTPAKLAWYVMCTRSASYFSSFRWSSFLALMQEKKQKKIKASAEAGEAGRVHEILRYVSGKPRRRPQPPSLDRRKEAKEDQGLGRGRGRGS